jgi:hypothetical protein
MIRGIPLLLLSALTLVLSAPPAHGQGFVPPAQPGPATPAADGATTTSLPAEEPLPLDRHTFDPPVPATVRKTSGTVLRGLWLGIDPDGVRFQTDKGLQFKYENKTVRTIRTLDGQLTYNPGKDELEKAVAAARLTYPKVVRPAPGATANPSVTGAGPGMLPGAAPGFPAGRPFPGAQPFGGAPFGGAPFSPGGPAGAHQNLPSGQQALMNSQNRAQQQIADLQRRQQESADAARQNANRALEQMREQLEASRRERWEGGRQIFEYEYRCRHCGHAFTSSDPSLGGSPCPKCHPTQARPGALAGSASGTTDAGNSSWSRFRIPRGVGKLVVAAVSGLALLGGAVLTAMRSGGSAKRRKRRAKSDEYEDY